MESSRWGQIHNTGSFRWIHRRLRLCRLRSEAVAVAPLICECGRLEDSMLRTALPSSAKARIVFLHAVKQSSDARFQHCHPPRSADTVNKILDDLRAGHQNVAEFWIIFQGKFVHIRYFAVRNDEGKYLGTVEL